LGIDPVKGRAPLGRSSAVEPGLAAALLAELALRGRVAVDGTSVAILDDSPTGDELLDDALAISESVPEPQRS